MRHRLSALVRKEFVQIRRDRRTLAMMVIIPVLWLIVFGYAATFDVRGIETGVVAGDHPLLDKLVASLEESEYFEVGRVDYPDRAALIEAIDEDEVSVGIVPPAGDGPGEFLADGTDLFTAQTAARQLQVLVQDLRIQALPPSTAAPVFDVNILYNPELRSADFMIPGLVGAVMVFIATMMTAVGVVRERERGTLEQLLVTPVRSAELMLGKIIPYMLIAFLDLVLVIVLGVYVFDVPFVGGLALLLALSLIFLIASLGIGLLVSTVSQTQQQALQLAVFTLLPQILLSGFVFPLEAIPWAVRWVSYAMPLTYFLPIARGVFLKGSGIEDLWVYGLVLSGYAVVMVALATVRFRRSLT
ncbi:MAG: ABC transporter permease [Thermoleophilia bacterium]